MRPKNPLRLTGSLAAAGALTIAVPMAVSPALAQTPTTGGAEAAAAPSSAPKAARPAPKKPRARVGLSSARRNVTLGNRTVVTGSVQPARSGRQVLLQVRSGQGWRTVARDRTAGNGAYRLRYTPTRAAALTVRVAFRGDRAALPSRLGIGRVNVFRRALASWYGPGLYGGHLACGGRLSPGTLGVAHKSLPCGAKVTLRLRGRSVRVPVVDRGPFVGNREYDLTAATKQRLGFSGVGTVLTTR